MLQHPAAQGRLRRSLTRALAGFAALMVALAACAVDPTPPPTTTTPPPVHATITPAPDNQEVPVTRIRLTVGDQVATATLLDNATARDFASLLPVTIQMHDLFGREKPGPLPRALDTGGERVFSYQLGDISYWSPNHDIAIFYVGDDGTIPNPGLIRLGVVDEGIEIIGNAGAGFTLTIEAVQ